MASKTIRIEHDLLGNKEVPADACYGIRTLRALENFQISGVPLCHYTELVQALSMVKMAAARNEIIELIREKKILPEEQIHRILDPASMTGVRQPS